jgi:hypothetical protein
MFYNQRRREVKELNSNECVMVSGGEIIAGWPSPEMMCLDIKLLVAVGRGDPGFDISAAVHALTKYCHDDFWDVSFAHEYATSGGIPLPPAPPAPGP